MPTLLLRSPSDPAAEWQQALQRALPELSVRIWPETGALDEIDYALVWASPDGFLHQLPRLRVVFSLGAGVDHLLGAELPDQAALVRMVDPALTQGMVEYVVYQVLRHHRHFHRYEQQQAREQWRIHPQRRPGERRVGLLGLGVLGGRCASALAELGFDVAGWARSAHAIPGVTAVHGDAGLDWLSRRSDILICLLPLTAATRGLLDARLFERMPRGATLINVARGHHLVADDLLVALGEGHLAHAVLDALPEEPLPPGHPLWHHPRVSVTPHIASLTHPETGAAHVANAIEADRAGQDLPHQVDRNRGY